MKLYNWRARDDNAFWIMRKWRSLLRRKEPSTALPSTMSSSDSSSDSSPSSSNSLALTEAPSSSSSSDSVFQRLPPELLERIIGSMNYEHVAMTRLVCQRFNRTCQSVLNQGFCKVDRLHTSSTKWVKSHLPRRESERRSHPLARHCDILSGIETRLSLLSMTYTKYIETGAACFIPGKVLDEVVRILCLVQGSAKATLEGNTSNLPRAHELLQELRDISSMAMEHFDEKIVPIIRYRAQQQQPSCGGSGSGVSNALSSPTRSFGGLDIPVFRGKITAAALVTVPATSGHQSPAAALNDFFPPLSPSTSASSPSGPGAPSVTPTQVPLSEFIQLKKKISTMKRKSDEMQKSHEETVSQQNSLIQSQNHTIQTQNQKIARLERRLDRLAKKFLDCSAKVEDILRCGQTGIKLKRKGDVDVALLSGDESESSVNPSPRRNDDDDENDEPDVGDDDDDEDGSDDDEAVGVEQDGNSGEKGKDKEREEAGDSAVKVDLRALAEDYESNKLIPKYSSPMSSSSSPAVPSALVGVGILKRSPIKLRLRQTPVNDGVDGTVPSSADETQSAAKNQMGNEGEAATATVMAKAATTSTTRGKGKSAVSKRKGKTAATTAGGKRRKAEKDDAESDASEMKEAEAPVSVASIVQRKRQKL